MNHQGLNSDESQPRSTKKVCPIGRCFSLLRGVAIPSALTAGRTLRVFQLVIVCAAVLVSNRSLQAQSRPRLASPANATGSQYQSPRQSRESVPTTGVVQSSVETIPQGEESAPKSLLETLERRGDLTLRNSSLEGALFTISELWGLNIVSGDVRGTVNGVFKNAPLREILDSILLSNNYGYRPVGDSLAVSPLSELGKVNPFFVSATIPIRNADVQEVLNGASVLSTPTGQIKALPTARALFVLDFPDRVKMIREFVASIDAASSGRPTATNGADPADPLVGPEALSVAYLKAQFVPAERAQVILETVLSPLGRISIMPTEDRLLVVDRPQNLEMVRQVLAKIDRPRPQVNIKALIYDISLQDLEEMGLNWGSNASWANGTDGAPASFFSVDSALKVPFSDGATGGTFTVMNLSQNFDINAVALALQSAGDSRLLADPNVTVLENEQAIIESVSEIPFQQLTQTAGGGAIGTTAFKNAGITLDVRPKIAYDGTVEMYVRPEFSRLTGFTPGDNQPIIDRRSATTTVRIANKQTFVLGGLRQRTDVGDFKGIPVLKDVRFFGHLFRARQTDIRESELVVFISPEIVGYADALAQRDRRIADTVRCRLAQIPEAEGCPSGGCHGCEGCADTGAARDLGGYSLVGESTPAAAPAQPAYGPVTSPAGVEGTTSQGVESLPVPSEPLFVPPPAPLGHRDMRRLPPIYSAVEAGEQAKEAPSKFMTKEPMRPSYSERFRSTGGVYASQQRTEPAPAEPEEEPKTAAKPSFWGRFFR